MVDREDKLREILEHAPRSRNFLAQYVGELELHRQEEDIFLRLAFENAMDAGAMGRGQVFVVSPVSELYEPLDLDRKLGLRRWWHAKVRQEASQHDDLRNRLLRLGRQGHVEGGEVAMSGSAPDVRFLTTRQSYAEGGTPRARDGYVFAMPDGSKVTVWVDYLAALTLDGTLLSPLETQSAAKALIEMELERYGSVDQEITLNAAVMEFVARRLGWLDRFLKTTP